MFASAYLPTGLYCLLVFTLVFVSCAAQSPARVHSSILFPRSSRSRMDLAMGRKRSDYLTEGDDFIDKY
jgi:hypothetical protein